MDESDGEVQYYGRGGIGRRRSRSTRGRTSNLELGPSNSTETAACIIDAMRFRCEIITAGCDRAGEIRHTFRDPESARTHPSANHSCHLRRRGTPRCLAWPVCWVLAAHSVSGLLGSRAREEVVPGRGLRGRISGRREARASARPRVLAGAGSDAQTDASLQRSGGDGRARRRLHRTESKKRG